MPIQWKGQDPLVRFWVEEGCQQLDVRGLLAQGGRPYAHIMSCVTQLGKGEVLVIHALFEPKPLVAQLEKRGLRCECRREGADHWTLTVFA